MLTVGAAQAGVADHPEDADWFRVSLQAGRRYRIDIAPDNAAGDPFGGDVALVDAAGAPIDADSVNGTLIYRPASDETVFATPSGGYGDSGAYRISAVLSEDSVGGDVRTSATIAPGQTLTGAIDFAPSTDSGADEDWFAVRLEAGRVYRFNLATPAWATDALDYPRLSMHAPTGTWLQEYGYWYLEKYGMSFHLLRVKNTLLESVITIKRSIGASATMNSRCR